MSRQGDERLYPETQLGECRDERSPTGRKGMT
jgi:hypothetical protein